MTRPDKKPTQKNDKVLPPIRCSEDERRTIREKAEKLGLSVSEYIRRAALDGKIVVRQGKHDFQVVDQLHRIGVNINQQTRKLNATGKVSPELKSLWVKLERLLDQIIKTL